MDIKRNKAAGSCLRRLRKSSGLTQRQVAERLHKTQSFVSKVENAERELSLVEAYPYAEAIDVSFDVFFAEVYASLLEEELA